LPACFGYAPRARTDQIGPGCGMLFKSFNWD
jgi:hypothetical protein